MDNCIKLSSAIERKTLKCRRSPGLIRLPHVVRTISGKALAGRGSTPIESVIHPTAVKLNPVYKNINK